MPAARLGARRGVQQAFQLAEEAVVTAPLVQQRVPEAAHDAVVALEGRLMVRAVRFPRDQKPRILPVQIRVTG